MRPSRPLTVKLLRDLWRLRAQAVAIALVMAAGVGMVVMSYGMIRSLEATREAYYARYALADLWAPLRRAPDRPPAASSRTRPAAAQPDAVSTGSGSSKPARRVDRSTAAGSRMRPHHPAP